MDDEKKKVRVIKDFELTHVSIDPGHPGNVKGGYQVSIGGRVVDAEFVAIEDLRIGDPVSLDKNGRIHKWPGTWSGEIQMSKIDTQRLKLASWLYQQRSYLRTRPELHQPHNTDDARDLAECIHQVDGVESVAILDEVQQIIVQISPLYSEMSKEFICLEIAHDVSKWVELFKGEVSVSFLVYREDQYPERRVLCDQEGEVLWVKRKYPPPTVTVDRAPVPQTKYLLSLVIFVLHYTLGLYLHWHISYFVCGILFFDSVIAFLQIVLYVTRLMFPHRTIKLHV